MKDCEAILVVNPLPPQREASLRSGASKSIHRVFMRVFGTNQFVSNEVERRSSDGNALVIKTLQEHLHSSMYGVIAYAVSESIELKVATQFVIDSVSEDSG